MTASLREAAQMALPAIPLLRTGKVQLRDFTLDEMQAYARAAIAAALALPDAEPVAYMYHDASSAEAASPLWNSTMLVFAADRRPSYRSETPLYAAPQPAQLKAVERVPLTDRQAYDCISAMVGEAEPFERVVGEGTEWAEFMKVVRAIEALHNIKSAK